MNSRHWLAVCICCLSWAWSPPLHASELIVNCHELRSDLAQLRRNRSQFLTKRNSHYAQLLRNGIFASTYQCRFNKPIYQRFFSKLFGPLRRSTCRNLKLQPNERNALRRVTQIHSFVNLPSIYSRIRCRWWRRTRTPRRRVRSVLSTPFRTTSTSTRIRNKRMLHYTQRRFLGLRYCLGKPRPVGCTDCSYLVQQGFFHVGIRDFPRSSHNQLRYLQLHGKAIPIQKVRRGDVVFFSKHKKGRITHSGLVSTQRQLLHATTKRGVILQPYRQWIQYRYMRVHLRYAYRLPKSVGFQKNRR